MRNNKILEEKNIFFNDIENNYLRIRLEQFNYRVLIN